MQLGTDPGMGQHPYGNQEPVQRRSSNSVLMARAMTAVRKTRRSQRLYLTGIHHVESKNIQGVALIALHFHPGTDMVQAMAEVVTTVNRSKAFMPPGTVPPFVMRFDADSVPVGYLVLFGDTRSIGEIQGQALFKVRPMFARLPGVSAPPPLEGSQRTIVVRVDPEALRGHNLSPQEVTSALTAGNAISPSGNIRVGHDMPIVAVNSMAGPPRDFGKIPPQPGKNVFLRDLGTVSDSTDIPTGYALVNGRRAVYILVTKRADASTLDLVNEVKRNLPRMQAVLPEDIEVSFEFDQSPYVSRAIWGVGIEGLLGATLTGLMVLIFLRDVRKVMFLGELGPRPAAFLAWSWPLHACARDCLPFPRR
jgi:multidrug efflux pump subunit AcrB